MENAYLFFTSHFIIFIKMMVLHVEFLCFLPFFSKCEQRAPVQTMYYLLCLIHASQSCKRRSTLFYQFNKLTSVCDFFHLFPFLSLYLIVVVVVSAISLCVLLQGVPQHIAYIHTALTDSNSKHIYIKKHVQTTHKSFNRLQR